MVVKYNVMFTNDILIFVSYENYCIHYSFYFRNCFLGIRTILSMFLLVKVTVKLV